MKIGFITDTNILTKKERDNNLKLCNEEKYLENMDFFINYIEDIKKINNKVEIVYLMPETIMKELKCQKIQAYHQGYKEFMKIYNNLKYGFSGEMPKNNIDEIVNKEEKEYLDFDKPVKLEYNVWGDKEIILKSLLLRNFREEDVDILEVKKEDNGFIVEVKFETQKYILQPKETIVVPRRNVKGVIKLHCQKEDKEIILKDYKIITVFFEKTFQERAQELANSLSRIIQFNEISKTLESLRINVEPLQQMKQNLGIDLYNSLLLNTNDDIEDYDENNDNEEDSVDE